MKILNVSKEKVKQSIISGFPNTYNENNFKENNDYSKKHTKMYKIENPNTGCVISIKIPNPDYAGEALHISTLYKSKNGKEYVVYPSKYSKITGRGHFKSKTIPRTKNWKRNLILEANTGFNLCKIIYESNKYINIQEKEKIYKLMDKRNSLIKERFNIDDKIKLLSRESIKNKYKKRRTEIRKKIQHLDNILGINNIKI